MKKKKKQKKKEKEKAIDYTYTFEMLRHYPSTRAFLIKKSIRPSMGETILELFFGSKKER